MANSIEEALDQMSAREVERVARIAERRLQQCATCGSDGAYPVTIHWKSGGYSHKASMLMCPKCLEKNRLPSSRSTGDD